MYKDDWESKFKEWKSKKESYPISKSESKINQTPSFQKQTKINYPEKSKKHFKPQIILLFCYITIIINMLLGERFYSLEWAFLGFILISIIFYLVKIDSRFLIFPALLLLITLPFLLLFKQQAIAETIAVYVYYFLVVGVILQIIEHFKKTENSLSFNNLYNF
ncbi:MAG: hypothetical protein AABY05_03470 [Nanoarchaeota archaeon]